VHVSIGKRRPVIEDKRFSLGILCCIFWIPYFLASFYLDGLPID
jgi:hypothetical protein